MKDNKVNQKDSIFIHMPHASVPTGCLNVEFICNVLVVADQLLITRLKEMCEVAITENCTLLIDLLPLTTCVCVHLLRVLCVKGCIQES